MGQIIKKREVNFDNRPSKSNSFKIDTKKVSNEDELLVNIKAPKSAFSGNYYFKGKDIVGLDSIHFYINEKESPNRIRWSGAQPFKTEIPKHKPTILGLRVAWMKNYNGVNDEDIPSGAGSYVTENLDGGEVYNFKPINGYYYGYARIQSRRNLRIERLGANTNDPFIENITVVLFARNPETGGEFIVGWYKDAILNRNLVSLPKGLRGKHSAYLTKALIKNSFLVNAEKRIFELPKDGPGQTNAWYIQEYQNTNFISKLEDYINDPDKYLNKRKGKKINHGGWLPDAEKRKKVELAAMEATADYYVNLGWDVLDVHKENLGWDMEVKKGNEHLLLEIKGLSGNELTVELSPNEYYHSIKHSKKFRVCIFNNALDNKKQKLYVFFHKNGIWTDISGLKLNVTEKTGAIFKL